MCLISFCVLFTHPLLIEFFLDGLMLIVNNVFLGRFVRPLVAVVVFRIKKSAADKGRVDILFVSTTIFEGTVED